MQKRISNHWSHRNELRGVKTRPWLPECRKEVYEMLPTSRTVFSLQRADGCKKPCNDAGWKSPFIELLSRKDEFASPIAATFRMHMDGDVIVARLATEILHWDASCSEVKPHYHKAALLPSCCAAVQMLWAGSWHCTYETFDGNDRTERSYREMITSRNVTTEFYCISHSWSLFFSNACARCGL